MGTKSEKSKAALVEKGDTLFTRRRKGKYNIGFSLVMINKEGLKTKHMTV